MITATLTHPLITFEVKGKDSAECLAKLAELTKNFDVEWFKETSLRYEFN